MRPDDHMQASTVLAAEQGHVPLIEHSLSHGKVILQLVNCYPLKIVKKRSLQLYYKSSRAHFLYHGFFFQNTRNFT
jgi:hypothetical protein